MSAKDISSLIGRGREAISRYKNGGQWKLVVEYVLTGERQAYLRPATAGGHQPRKSHRRGLIETPIKPTQNWLASSTNTTTRSCHRSSAQRPLMVRSPSLHAPMQCLCTLDLLSHRISDAVPDPILQYNQGRWRQYLGWLRALGAVNGEAGDVDFSIRVVRIAFAVSAKQRRASSGNLE